MPMTPAEFDAAFTVKPPNPKFEAWMAKVDAAIATRCHGLTSSDLEDFMYCDAFEDGATPRQAAAAAIKAAGG